MSSELANLKSEISDYEDSRINVDAPSDSKSQISNRVLAAIVLVWLIVLPTILPQAFRAIFPSQDSAASLLPIPLEQTLDPNAAPWYELSALPGIGDDLAKRIVEFRDAACASGAERAFENTADLQKVRGIGPKTAAKLSPFLRYEKRCADTSTVSGRLPP